MRKIVRAKIYTHAHKWSVRVVTRCPRCNGDGEWSWCDHCEGKGAVHGDWFCHVSCGCAGTGIARDAKCPYCTDEGCNSPVACPGLLRMEKDFGVDGSLIHYTGVDNWAPSDWSLSSFLDEECMD